MVAMDKVAVAAPPVTVTGVVEPKLKVGSLEAPAGLLVSVALSATEPVKPAVGVTVTIEVLPVVAPALRETFVSLTEKPGGPLTAMEVVPVDAALLASPE
jgi:hypothetical protein